LTVDIAFYGHIFRLLLMHWAQIRQRLYQNII